MGFGGCSPKIMPHSTEATPTSPQLWRSLARVPQRQETKMAPHFHPDNRVQADGQRLFFGPRHRPPRSFNAIARDGDCQSRFKQSPAFQASGCVWQLHCCRRCRYRWRWMGTASCQWAIANLKTPHSQFPPNETSVFKIPVAADPALRSFFFFLTIPSITARYYWLINDIWRTFG